jgi:hypothetical protein
MFTGTASLIAFQQELGQQLVDPQPVGQLEIVSTLAVQQSIA